MTVNIGTVSLAWGAATCAARAGVVAAAPSVGQKVAAAAKRGISTTRPVFQAPVASKHVAVVAAANALIDRGNLGWVRHVIPPGLEGEKAVLNDQVSEGDVKDLQRLGHVRIPTDSTLHNNFLRWLRTPEDTVLPGLKDGSTSLFMNSSDFVYLALLQAEVVQRSKIAAIYQREFDECAVKHEHSITSYYGFDLLRTKALAEAEPGDILVVKYLGRPIHAGIYLGDHLIGHMWDLDRYRDEDGDEIYTPKFSAFKMHLRDLLLMHRRPDYNPITIGTVSLDEIDSID